MLHDVDTLLVDAELAQAVLHLLTVDDDAVRQIVSEIALRKVLLIKIQLMHRHHPGRARRHAEPVEDGHGAGGIQNLLEVQHIGGAVAAVELPSALPAGEVAHLRAQPVFGRITRFVETDVRRLEILAALILKLLIDGHRIIAAAVGGDDADLVAKPAFQGAAEAVSIGADTMWRTSKR